MLSITDHFTRVKMGLGAAAMGAAPPRVFGMLFGRQSGRKVEIYEAKELNVVVGDGRGPLVFLWRLHLGWARCGDGGCGTSAGGGRGCDRPSWR